MNILFIKTPNIDWINLSKNLQDKYNWKTVGWIGLSKNFKFFNKNKICKKQKYFSHEKFLKNEVDDYIFKKNISPLNQSKIFLNELRAHTPIILELINRWFDYGYNAEKELKLNYTKKIISDISDFIKEYEIDIIICPTIPHRIYDYVFYVICKKLNKPFLMIEESAGSKIINDKLEPIFFGIFDLSKRTSYHKILQSNQNDKYNKEIDKLIKFFHNNIGKKKFHYNYERIFIKRKKIKYLIPKKLRLLINLVINILLKKYNHGITLDSNSKTFTKKTNFIQNINYKLDIHTKTIKALNFYNEVSVNNNFPNNFIFFAGSKIPERTQCPDGGLYYDPLRMLTKLSKNIPENYFIVYKEHPSNFIEPFIDYRKNIEFYKKLFSLKNVIFADLKVSSQFLIENSFITSSGTGTVCWEAALRGKQSIIFGSVWYENLKTVTRVRNSYDIQLFFKNYKSLSKNDIEKEIYLFLNNLFDHSYDLRFRRKIFFNEKNIFTNNYIKKLDLLASVYFDTYKNFQTFNQI